MKNLLLFAFILLTIGFTSCVKKLSPDGPTPVDPGSKLTKDLVVPASFNFQTTKDVSLNILVQNSSSVLTGVPVSVYLDYPGVSEAPNVNARLVGKF